MDAPRLTRADLKTEATHGIVCSLPHEYFGYFGWPTIARMDDGTLAAAASGLRSAHVDPFGRSTLCLSYDEGRTWTHPRVINDTPLDDRDTGLLSLGGRKLLLTWFTSSVYQDDGCPEPFDFIRQGDERRFLGSWVRTSDDGGLTWNEPVRVEVNSPHGPTLLRNGELLYLGKRFDHNTNEFDQSIDGLAAIRSADGGRTWARLGWVPFAEGTPLYVCGEPHAVELPDGTLLGMIRYHGPDKAGPQSGIAMMQTMSTDGGRTWSEACHLDFLGSPPHLLLHSSGAVVCVYGYRLEPYGERAMISRDGGRSWTYDYILCDNAPDWDLGYPSSVELPDASILTMYYQKAGGTDEKCSLLWTRWKLPD